MCCALSLLFGAFMTGCADDKQASESVDTTEVSETTNVGSSANADDNNNNVTASTETTSPAGDKASNKGNSSENQTPERGKRVTFTWHPQGIDYASYDPNKSGDVELQHKTINCRSNGDGTFSFTTRGGNRLTASFTKDYIPALDEYDVSIVDENGNKVIMPTNGGEWLLVDGGENTPNATFL